MSAYQPFGQSIYIDAVTVAANWTEVITVGAVTTGSSYELCTSPARSVGALGQYRYQIWPLYPPWWPGWDDGDDEEDGDCLPDWWESHPFRKDYPLEGTGEEQKVVDECLRPSKPKN